MDEKKHEPGFIRINVSVTQNSDGTFTDKFKPEVIKVVDSDTVLHFQLDGKTSSDIVIRSVTVNPEDQDQLSTPSIGKSGRHATLSDINTISDKFHLTFEYQNKHAQRLAITAKRSADCEAEQYPEIENIPPG